MLFQYNDVAPIWLMSTYSKPTLTRCKCEGEYTGRARLTNMHKDMFVTQSRAYKRMGAPTRKALLQDAPMCEIGTEIASKAGAKKKKKRDSAKCFAPRAGPEYQNPETPKHRNRSGEVYTDRESALKPRKMQYSTATFVL